MKPYLEEIYQNDLYKVRHIAGMNAGNSALTTYHASSKLIFCYYAKCGGEIIIDGSKHKISDGDLFIMKPSEFFRHIIDNNSFHERIALSTTVQILKNFPPDYSDVLLPFYDRKNGTKNCIPCEIVKAEGLSDMFHELLTLSKSETNSDKLLSLAKVIQILSTISKIIANNFPRTTNNSVGNAMVNDIMKYLNANYTKDISITDVTKNFNMDRSYLSKIFKEQTGMSMWEYVILRRIYLFNYLITDNVSLEETAYKVGFKNYSNFYRLYKKYMQITPIEFKKSASLQK